MREYLLIAAFIVFFGALALSILHGLNHKFPERRWVRWGRQKKDRK